VNTEDLSLGMEIRERLALLFWSTHPLGQRTNSNV
jgi:hypothetical protein